MKILDKNLKKGEIKIKVENLDDLWYLSTIIEPNDVISGMTERKIKIESSDRANKVTRKFVFMAIKAEKIEYSKNTSALRINGTIILAPEDIPHGSYHTFNIEPENTIITIQKEKWLKYQIEKIEESLNSAGAPIIICAFDRESAVFAISKQYGYEIVSTLKGDVPKKVENNSSKGDFYKEILDVVKSLIQRYNSNYAILASPAFFKDEIKKKVTQDIEKKIFYSTCSSSDPSAINEILKRPEIQNVLIKDRTTKEILIVDKLLAEISKDGLCAYGITEVKSSIDFNSVKILLITDKLIQKYREENNFIYLEKIMKDADNSGTEITIISSDNEAGKKLDGLGGIGAILRFKVA